MKISHVLVLAWVGSLAACVSHNANAFTIDDAKLDITGIDLNQQIKEFVCGYINCPQYIQVDQIQVHGTQLAALHVSTHIYF